MVFCLMVFVGFDWWVVASISVWEILGFLLLLWLVLLWIRGLVVVVCGDGYDCALF